MLYAYGVVRPDQPCPGVAGIDGAAVALVDAGGVRVAVSELADGAAPTPERLARHHRVAMALLASGGLVPLRFGQTFESETSLRTALEGRGEELARKLDELAGCVELGVRVALDGRPIPLAADGTAPGRAYLLAKKARLEIGQRLRAHVGDLARDWRQELAGDSLKAACLAGRERVPELKARLAGFDPRPRITGPWPPSSFV
jgi:hypothetical protein